MQKQNIETELFSCFLQFREKHDELLILSADHSVITEYGIGGQTLYLGYYCPSKVYDIIVGNTSRGRIIRRGTKGINADYIFYKDNNNRIIKTEKLASHSQQIVLERSFFIHQSNHILIPTYVLFDSDKPLLCQLCICSYNDEKISRYSIITVHNVYAESEELLLNNAMFYSEEYQYDTQGSFYKVSILHRFQNISKTENYLFYKDENGLISSYCPILEQINGKPKLGQHYIIPKSKRRTI